jgi:hypothetical protein
MSQGEALSWRTVPAPLRTLGRWVTVIQIVGYTTSLLFVWHTTRLTPAGVAERYRGAADTTAAAGAMKFHKSFAEMLTITHTHLLGMAAIFTISGLCLALCDAPAERHRKLLIAEPFAALLVSFSAMWLMRYEDARFSWLLELSSASLAVVFYMQSWYILRGLNAVARVERA